MAVAIQKGYIQKVIEANARKQAEETAKRLANEIYAKAQSLVPVDTGELKQSCKVVRVRDGVYDVVYDCKHAIYAHEQPQSIRKSGYSQFLSIAVADVGDDVYTGAKRTPLSGGEL